MAWRSYLLSMSTPCDVDLADWRWKLQVLDLCRNSHQDFWTTWSSITARVCLLMEPEPGQPMQKRCRAEVQAGLKLAWAPLQVVAELCLKEDTLEQTLCYLLKKVKQEKPATPVLPEAENLRHAHAEHKGDPEGGAAGLCRGRGGELHLEGGHAGQVYAVPGLDGQPVLAAALAHPSVVCSEKVKTPTQP
ncbi:hypothetical protein E5288_WYG005075 [Bos mutus]|uniref:Uncharacterized protein n=1 Tax=Bos mutus TaxID=72004 RepID=A0A6B0SAM8_9CETA|nr:hypothetical protein [Bos mutus]